MKINKLKENWGLGTEWGSLEEASRKMRKKIMDKEYNCKWNNILGCGFSYAKIFRSNYLSGLLWCLSVLCVVQAFFILAHFFFDSRSFGCNGNIKTCTIIIDTNSGYAVAEALKWHAQPLQDILDRNRRSSRMREREKISKTWDQKPHRKKVKEKSESLITD